MKAMKLLKDLIGGFFMAVANSVPGVSGGTIALLLGFYDRFMGAVNDLVFHKGKRLSGLIYILRVGGGWVVGLAISVTVLDRILDAQIYGISSLFFGFILLSVPFLVYDERECLHGKYYYSVFALLGFLLIAGMSWISVTLNTPYVVLTELTPALWVKMFVIGVLSTVALLCPGISGSTVFLAFGVYRPIIAFLHALVAFDTAAVAGALPALSGLGVGALIGAFIGVKGINYCLKRFRKQTVYFAVGMLVGSLVSILVAPMTIEPQPGQAPNTMMNASNFNWICFFIGAALVMTLQMLKLRRNRKLAASDEQSQCSD